MAPDTPYEAVADVTKKLALPEHFVVTLLAEDDWSYIIKSHALVESAITYAIARKIEVPESKQTISRISMRQRIDLAGILNVVSNEILNGVRHLSKMRNLLAHDVSEVNFTFDTYLRNEEYRNAFFGIYLEGVTGTIDLFGKPRDKKEFFKENPKWAINECIFNLLLDIYLVETEADIRKLKERLSQQLFAAVARDK